MNPKEYKYLKNGKHEKVSVMRPKKKNIGGIEEENPEADDFIISGTLQSKE